jgi:endoglucanase Acf2
MGGKMFRNSACAVSGFVFLLLAHQPSFGQVQVGAGSYVTSGNFAVPPTTPYITTDFTQKVISAKWWSTLMTTQYSGALYAHPLSFQANAGGLDIGYPGAPGGAAGDFSAGHARSLTVGISGMNAADVRVASYSHFAVTGRWTNGAIVMEATMAQGVPFVFFKITGGTAVITFNGTPTVWYNQNGVIGLTVGGKNYGIFAPTGSAWSGTGPMTSTLSGKDYLSVAVLPDNTQNTLNFFKQYAYSFVRETRVSWVYDEASARLTSTFAVTTDVKEGTENGTVFALMRHQWLHAALPVGSYTYQSGRGVMKTTSGQSFSTVNKFNGILLSMPDTGFTLATLQTLVQNEGVPGNIGGNTYNKDFGKYSQLVQIADMVGNTTKRDQLIAVLKSSLQNWFTGDGNPQFYYHQPWNRLIGYPAAYGSDTRLSDHHFHYGYFVKAAAIVAQWDKTWASQANWGGMVEMLIRDVNTWNDNDPLFGRFAYFEPYEGHGWADGMGFDRGNNQESSSEAMNFNAGVILWGMMTGNKVVRDLGIFMYVNETSAIEQYWWDVDNVTFPTVYTHTCVGMVWSNGGAYGTWFSGNTGAIHGINMLPNTAGHLYYGRCPSYIPLNYNEAMAGQPQWYDLFYEFLAYSNAATALGNYSGATGIEGGNTRAACYHELTSLNAVGRLDTEVVGSTPSFAVFDKGTVRTYCVYNPDATAKTVTFNDGFSMSVLSGKQICTTGAVRPVAVRSVAPLKSPVTGAAVKIVAAGGRRALPVFAGDVRNVALYTISGEKVWESPVVRGRCVRQAGLGLLLTQGVYLLKQFK